ncbi:hypothetical protein RRG08_024448 [Elysia crispata]|uniref:Uncharacterized protein n=1 Tax=Elysia crispata TaxID=231223 RepID=A0AAE0YQ05_9GAST|nr:hypothetical protein RRG08_024448 [Elysia crispata]
MLSRVWVSEIATWPRYIAPAQSPPTVAPNRSRLGEQPANLYPQALDDFYSGVGNLIDINAKQRELGRWVDFSWLGSHPFIKT